MPIYMDLHIVPGVTAKDVAEAHRQDVLVQQHHACKCMTYWIDEKRGNVFCLIEAPDKTAVMNMHNQAHGLMPHRIIEVNDSLVESFLGRISDPEDAEVSGEGLMVFKDPSFRILVLTGISDPTLLQHRLGRQPADDLLRRLNELVRQELCAHGGSEAAHNGPGFILSFTTAAKAIACALSIQHKLIGSDMAATGFKMALHGGEPVETKGQLFGETIQLASQMCYITNGLQVAVSSVVREMVSAEHLQHAAPNLRLLTRQDELFLGGLFDTLEQHWQDPGFTIEQYCHSMAMSKSQLYRKTLTLCGLSPNVVLKDFRLEKARQRMRQQQHSISQISFDAGFCSSSYFTKCFKKKYGLLPLNYQEMQY